MHVNFVAGLPRSGSTLLMNLLAQNPIHHCSPTSGVIDLFGVQLRGWREAEAFKAQGLDVVKPSVIDAMGGTINGFYKKQLSKGKYCFDKSRGWPQFIEHLCECLERPVKLIVTVRDVRAIVASMERMFRERSIDWVYPVGEEFFNSSTAMGRAQVILRAQGLVGHPINQLRDLMSRCPDSVHLVPYDKLVSDPIGTLEGIHEALELPPFDNYDPDNVEQTTVENDSVHGRGGTLHKIRPKVESPENKKPWMEYFTDQWSKEMAMGYADVHEYWLG